MLDKLMPGISRKLRAKVYQDGEKLTRTISRAIDMIPRTLTTIGECLMKQTGWCITILAGGPHPESDGKILTYL